MNSYPKWAEQLRQMYKASECSIFVLHGNINDYVINGDDFQTLPVYINKWMSELNKHFIEWSLYKGSYSLNASMPDKLKAAQNALSKSSCLLIPHSGALIPNGDPQYRSMDERMMLAALKDWSMSDELSKSDSLIILLAETLSELPGELFNNPRIGVINIPMASEEDRLKMIQTTSKQTGDKFNKFASLTAGLKLVQLQSIFSDQIGLERTERVKIISDVLSKDSSDNLDSRVQKMADITGGMTQSEIMTLLGQKVSEDVDQSIVQLLFSRKKAIIEKECAGLIEFMDSKHGMDAVGGNEHIKEELMSIAKLIRSGNKKLSPMGLLAVGAMGSGKTFVIKAFLKEAGLTGVTLKNFRSKWVGSTESNLEKVLDTVKAMGPIAVVIDESDRSFGNGGGGDNDGGTSSRVIARLKEFMSDTENRGKVLFIMMTNRPDKLDSDIKRPGRLDRKIPFFYAGNESDLLNILKVICKRYDVPSQFLKEEMLLPLIGYSNADLEALVGLYAHNVASYPDKDPIDLFHMAAADFIPPQEKSMIEYMNLQAVKEASRKSLVPKQYHDLYENNLLEKRN